MLGFLNINKPQGLTSNAVVQKIKKKFNIKKIGHLGTLDPMATGVLPIAIGKATRLFDYSLDKTKRYTAIFDFGYTTDTLDTTGEIIKSGCYIPTEKEIINACDQLIGDIDQVPPNFSAKNIKGMRAYDLARQGIQFDLKPKKIKIHRLEFIEQISDFQFKFDIVCSSGTYIRAIARDLADILDTYACMSYLQRTETGIFNINSSIDLDELINNHSSINEYILSPLDVFNNFEKIEINDKTFNDLINGKKPEFTPIMNDNFIIYNNQIVGIAMKNCDNLILETFLYETKEGLC